MRITIYCGSTFGKGEIYIRMAEKIADWIIEKKHSLVYGGGNNGLMGVIANRVLKGGCEVYGVIPRFLKEKELAHAGISRLEIVENMSERKYKMLQTGDVFLALPGGPGTLEEITEAISWARIGQNSGPCILFNRDGYYEPLRAMYQKMAKEGFYSEKELAYTLFSDDLEEIERFIQAYHPPAC